MQTRSTTFEIYRPIPFEQQPSAPGPLPFAPPQVLEDPNVPVAEQDVQYVPTTRSYNFGPCRILSHSRIPNSYPTRWQPPMAYQPTPVTSAVNVDMVQALRQVANTPKLEYLRFDGDPMKYGAFLHNFENFLE
jgi:hypothetical protein